MTGSASKSNQARISFSDMCKLVTQASRMSQAIPYYGRVPARSIENLRKMAASLESTPSDPLDDR